MILQQAMQTFLPLVEEELRACLSIPPQGEPAFLGMIHYHMGWTDEHFEPVPAAAKTGKRIRPLVTLLACQAAGGDPRRALPAAAAVEIIHNFSLVHDDIEDRSVTRRGRRTVWSLWGEAQAINAGDTLFALAHLALQRLPRYGATLDRVSSALCALDETCLALCQGQHLDMAFEKTLDVDVEAYMRMIAGKTAALLGCAAHMGALMAPTDVATAKRFERIGWTMGLAFQIQDDVLGIWGDPSVTGKPVADDIRSRKQTLPILYVMQGTSHGLAQRLRALYERDALAESDVAEAVAILDAAGARAHAEGRAHYYLDQALRELEAAQPEPEAAAALRELACFMVERVH
jgi:geranylgeranyl diphosphate synthase type I